ncbi:MAG: MFS transporter [Pseudomonadota bacterium]
MNENIRNWSLLIAMGAAVGLIALNETAVGLTLPTIRHELGMSAGASHWVVNAYLLVLAAFIAVFGKLGDLVGLRPIYFGGVLVFGLSSIVCAAADDGTVLIVARAVQGLGAAALYPASLAMSTMIFPPEREGWALGVFSGVAAGFLVLGPLVGGFFTEVVSWRWIFWINVPLAVGIIALVIVCRFKSPREPAPRRFDIAGLVTLVAGLAALVIGLMEGAAWGWDALQTWAVFAVAAVLLTVFTIVELRHPLPLIRVAMFGDGIFSFANLATFIGMFQRMVLAVFGALYLQHNLGMNPLVAGLALLPAMVPIPIAAVYAGKLADRMSSLRLTLIGLLVVGLVFVWVAGAMLLESYAVLVPALVIWGIFMALTLAPPRKAALAQVDDDMRGEASGILLGTQLLGATVGVAFASAVLQITDSYAAVFLATAAVTLAILALGPVMARASRRQ